MHSTTSASRGCPEYRSLSRRQVLGAGAATGVAAFLASHAWLPRVSFASSHRSAQRDVVISIYLRGALDALTMCVPYFENSYYSLRPTQRIPRPDSSDPSRCIALDDRFGFPPSMAPLMPAFTDGSLLIVHAVGSESISRSHFEAQRVMEAGGPDATIPTGWLGRHISSVAPLDPSAAMRAVALAPGLPQSLVGGPLTLPVPVLAAFGLTGYGPTSTQRQSLLAQMYAQSREPMAAAAATTNQTIAMLAAIDFSSYVPANGAVYPTSHLAFSLQSAAALIRAEVGVEAIAIDVGGWDTHDNQGSVNGALANQLSMLSSALAAFHRDVIAGGGPGVTVVVMSEFGRRVQENGNQGTDHGHGGCMMVLGQAVAGGRVMTQWPGLAPAQLFEGRDLEITMDYRDILAEVVQQRLGNPNLSVVLPGHTPIPRGVFT